MSDDINHSGIKGQKWGIRRFQNKDGTLTPQGVIRYRKDKKVFGLFKKSRSKSKQNKIPEGKKLRKRHLSELTSDEIKEKINRLKVENEYIKEYNTRYPKKIKKASEHKVRKFIGKISGDLVTQYAKGKMEAYIHDVYGVPYKK